MNLGNIKVNSNKIFILLFILIILIGGFLRFYQLDLKPLHHDEAVLEYFYVQPIIDGQPLSWDFENHGFFYNYITAFFVLIFSKTIFSIRFASALFGTLTIGLFYFLKNFVGKPGVFLAASLFAFSPVLIYFSKQYTNYPFYLFFALLFIIILFNYIKFIKSIHLYILAIISAILLNINLEAFAVFVFLIVSFVFLQYLFSDKNQNIDKYIKTKSIIFSFILFLVSFIIIQTDFFKQPANFTSLLTNFDHLFTKAVSTGHNKSFLYYFKLMIPYELTILFFYIISLIFIIKRNLLKRFLIFWSVSTILIFSLIAYKTNWAVVILLLPMILAASYGFNLLYKNKIKYNYLLITLAVLGLCFSLYFAYVLNFVIINSFNLNKVGYVETSADINQLMQKINQYSHNNEINKVLITAESYWPIPFYLQNHKIDYLTEIKNFDPASYPDYQVIISNQDQISNSAQQLNWQSFELRDNYNIYLYLAEQNLDEINSADN